MAICENSFSFEILLAMYANSIVNIYPVRKNSGEWATLPGINFYCCYCVNSKAFFFLIFFLLIIDYFVPWNFFSMTHPSEDIVHNFKVLKRILHLQKLFHLFVFGLCLGSQEQDKSSNNSNVDCDHVIYHTVWGRWIA